MANRWGIPKHVEEFVKQRDTQCVYCGSAFTNITLSYKTRPTWEHIINDIRINDIDNIALCCGSCNASKGSKTLENWLETIYCSVKGISKKTVAQVVLNSLGKE